MNNWDINIIENLVKTSYSFSEVLKKFGLSKTGQKIHKLKKFCVDNKIYTGHFNKSVGIKKETPIAEIFIENSAFNPRWLKAKILKYNLKEYKCEICNLRDWLEKEISLQVDHINGVNTDHRIENLRFLCPNCHSQTDTWGAKIRKNTAHKAK